MKKSTWLRIGLSIAAIITLVALSACSGSDEPSVSVQTSDVAGVSLAQLTPTQEPIAENTADSFGDPGNITSTPTSITVPTSTATSTKTPSPTFTSTSTPVPTLTPTPTVVPTRTPLSVDDIYKRLKASTVYVYANTADGASVGTGIIYASNGYVVTNAHVVQKATSVRVYLEGSKSSLAAEVLGISYCDDLAVLDIEGDGFVPAIFGDSSMLKRGEQVVAVGYPLSRDLGVDLVVTSGQVNRLNAHVENLESAIQTDAPINPGNSGGPLANSSGEVIGINTTRINATGDGQRVTGVSFAIASNFATPIMSQLEAGQNLYWTGIDFRVDSAAKRLVVTSVEDGSPADTIGIEKGDVLISIEKSDFQTQYEACSLLKGAGYEEQGVTIDLMRGQTKLTGRIGRDTVELEVPSFTQEISQTLQLAETEIVKQIRQNSFVTDLGHDGQEWIVVFTLDVGFRDQRIRIEKNHSALMDLLDDQFQEGYFVTDLAYGDAGWIAVLSAGTSFSDQKVISGRFFPGDDIDALLSEGYAITSIASGGELWFVVMSVGSGYIDQQYEFVDRDLSNLLSELTSNGRYISLIAPSDRILLGDTWIVVHSERGPQNRQRHLITPVVSEDVIGTIQNSNAATIDAIQSLNGEWVILYR